MIKIGDRVKFVSDTGVGIVRSIEKGIAQVEVDGFQIPAMVSDIVPVDNQTEDEVRRRIGPSSTNHKTTAVSKKSNSYGRISIEDEFEDDTPIDIAALKRNYAAQQKATVKDQAAPIKIEVPIEPPHHITDYSVALAFEPTTSDRSPEEADLNLYLVNDSSYTLAYSIGRWEKADYITTLKAGVLSEDSQELICKFPRLQLANLTRLHISLMPFKHTSYTPQEATDTTIELHPLKFVRPHSYKESEFTELPSIIFDLTSK